MTLLLAIVLWFALMFIMTGPFLMALVWASNTRWGRRQPDRNWRAVTLYWYVALIGTAAYVSIHWYMAHA